MRSYTGRQLFQYSVTGNNTLLSKFAWTSRTHDHTTTTKPLVPSKLG
uniref:Uncharacterized protein n=1 Tax=Arundo donax TaxID=35708 RepID=A0A0A9EJE7_ARUDO